MSLVSGLKNIRISRKLYAGFGLVLLLVAIASALSVMRFRDITNIYDKTNLIYNINIEVFQAKINRLKYFYSGDDKTRDIMAKFVSHAQELVQEAKGRRWSAKEAAMVDDLGTQLQGFQDNITQMGQATQALRSVKQALEDHNAQDMTGQFAELIRTPVSNTQDAYAIYDFLLLVGSVNDQALSLRLSGTESARAKLEQTWKRAGEKYQQLSTVLPPEQLAPFTRLWKSTSDYKSVNDNYLAAFNGLKAAEDNVKTSGDKSSAIIKQLIATVKIQNDKLAYGSASITVVIGLVAILIGIFVTWYITRQITRPVVHNLSLAQRIASGDLSATIQSSSNDELGKLTSAMGQMNTRLRTMISEVRNSVLAVTRSASAIAEGNTDLSARTEQQSAAVVETAASMEQLTSTVRNNADNARHASQIAAEATNNAVQGGEVVRNVVSTMADISSSSKKISDITAVINSIAFQTNILALNAAVEAARAGEQGRGFAVVASEVRSLSQRSSQAAKDIATLIDESVSRINTGSSLVAQAGENMEQIVTSVRRVNDIMGEISSASEEQSRGIAQIAQAISELDTTTQQNASLVMESSSAANALEEQATLLEQLVASFRLGDAPATVPSLALPGKGTKHLLSPVKPTSTQDQANDEGWTTF
ncbi:methyl-accepting chemotaxis protein [Mangrovibacter yixingensis]|uniref:methyl-accepting chemotaxis protein n=1 Tax=Mangrovibacter yixingensis TaxID=1529639 RepID=UPI001CFD6FC5|nr:methyl-accepting chemotaxis protein [Mangrovibacter yixingensis]